jgi:hypothetical protein
MTAAVHNRSLAGVVLRSGRRTIALVTVVAWDTIAW